MSIKKIKEFINTPFFEKFILLLIFLNLIVYILDSMSSFHNTYSYYVQKFELVSIIIFTLEYLLRLITINNFKDIFKPMMLIDLFVIIPYWLSSINTIFLRILRFSRFLRLLKVSRYSTAFDNIINAFKTKKEELIITFSIFSIGVIISGIFMYYAENSVQPNVFSSIPKSIYFSIITFTSVGYGDIVPVTKIGEIICAMTAIFGIALHGLFVGVIGTAFMEALKNKTCNKD